MTTRYRPPVVAYASERPPWAGKAAVACWLALAAVMLGWALQPQAIWSQQAAAGFFLLLAAFLLWQQYRLWPTGRLLWNGECWTLGDAAAAAEPASVFLQVALDGGSWLWVEAHAAGAEAGGGRWRRRVRWLYLSQRQSPERWGDLRRAVYSPVAPLPEPG